MPKASCGGRYHMKNKYLAEKTLLDWKRESIQRINGQNLIVNLNGKNMRPRRNGAIYLDGEHVAAGGGGVRNRQSLGLAADTKGCIFWSVMICKGALSLAADSLMDG